jgi:hypothetical protein
MRTPNPPPPDPLFLALSRKLVLLLLVMVTSAIGLVALLLQTRVSIPVLAFVLTDGLLGLLAGFSVRWILPGKLLVLRIISAAVFIIGGLALLGWFTGWGFGIDLFRAGPSRVDAWELGQVLLAGGFALLALFAWQYPVQSVSAVSHTRAARSPSHARRKPQKRPSRAPKPRPAVPAISQTVQPVSQKISTQAVKAKRKRASHPRPRLVLSSQEEHRCPYCLEIIDPDDPRGVVECEICHTLHHADCWAITGACQVPHFTA